MKTDFRDSSQMMSYIYRIFDRNTDLKKECQICGKPAKLKYNKWEPYKIQLVCDECRKTRHTTNLEGMYLDIPVIDLKEHFKEDKIKREEFKTLTEENRNKIEALLKTKLNKIDAIKSVGLTIHQYNILVDKYEYEVDAFIKIRLKEVFNKNRAKVLKKNAIKRSYREYSNNLYRIKKERNLSNKQISELTDGKITGQQLSLISTDKCEPKMKTKCELARALHLSVADIFPKDYLFKEVYNYAYYLEYVNNFIIELENYINKNKTKSLGQVVNKISFKTSIPSYRIYDFLSRRSKPNHREMVIIKEKILKTFNKVVYN